MSKVLGQKATSLPPDFFCNFLKDFFSAKRQGIPDVV
jgi:hypothetical protein